MLIEEVTAILGRRPNTDELTFINSVMGSIQIQYPYPSLNSIIMEDEQGSGKNGQLVSWHSKKRMASGKVRIINTIHERTYQILF